MSKFCIECGCQMDDNAKFCPQCGSPAQSKMDKVLTEGKDKEVDTVVADNANGSSATEFGTLHIEWKGTWILFDSSVILYVNGHEIGAYSFKDGFKVDVPITSSETEVMVKYSFWKTKRVYTFKPHENYTCKLDFSRFWGKFSLDGSYNLTGKEKIVTGCGIGCFSVALLLNLLVGVGILGSKKTNKDNVAQQTEVEGSVTSSPSEEVSQSTSSTEESKNVDFIRGGVTYKGLAIKENAGPDQNERRETEYTIKCFNDGTMIWTENETFRGETKVTSYQGTWGKETVSRFDEIETTYRFWASTLTGGKKTLGWTHDDGELYTFVSVTKPVCKLSAQ